MSRPDSGKKTEADGKKPARSRRIKPPEGSEEAKRVASVILQAMAGCLGTAEAAAELGVSPPMYYKVEGRALQGLINGCEPRARGRAPSAEKELAELRQQIGRLERQCTRYQTLLRSLQRTLGAKGSKAAKSKAKPASGKGSRAKTKAKAGKKRKRKTMVRALRLSQRLDVPGQAQGQGSDGEPEAAPETDGVMV